MCLEKIEKAQAELDNEENALNEAYGYDVRAEDTDYTVIDSLFGQHRKRIDACLRKLNQTINNKTKELLLEEPELHKLIHERV